MDLDDIRGRIDAEEIILGQGVVLGPGTRISGLGGPAKRVVLGDHVFLGGDSTIRVPSLEIGDYTQIHNHALIAGYCDVQIGHNGWFGQNVILNATEKLTIGDNCGVGAYSQLWTHILFGDVMEGCRFDSSSPLTIGRDVWFVGHCIVSQITAADRSMAMVGSVVTRDMAENRVYAGSPAKDITEKVGPQFQPVSLEAKADYLEKRIAEFLSRNPDYRPGDYGIAVEGSVVRPGRHMFEVSDRTYNKTGEAAEVAFMKSLLPRAKFTPK